MEFSTKHSNLNLFIRNECKIKLNKNNYSDIMAQGKDEYSEKFKKNLDSRIKQFKKALKSEKQKNELYDSICGSEILVRLEIFLPSDNPETYVDGLYLYMNDSGKIVDAEYYLREGQEVALAPLTDSDLEVIRELFQDEFSLEIE